MSSRAKKILIAIVVIILLVIAILIWLFMQKEPAVVVNTNQPEFVPVQPLNTSSNKSSLLDVVTPTPPPAGEKPDARSALKRIAASYAERYGSYSNQGDFENLTELKAFMTDSLAATTDANVVQMRAARVPGAPFVGVTTRSLISTVDEFDEQAGTATVRVNTQRQEDVSGTKRIYYQELTLDFVLEGEIWKVNSANWGEEKAAGG